MMGDSFKYDSVFAQVSFQFCGHVDDFLIHNTRRLCLFYMQTRFGKGGHAIRLYEEGKLVEERHLSSSKSIVGYYLGWLWLWHRELRKFSKGQENVIALYCHPIGSVGMSLRRNVRHVFWQWDYFPGHGVTERLFNLVAGFYASRCYRYIPLTNAIAKAMKLPGVSPIMLGVKPPKTFGDASSSRILMVGQLRHGQGVEDVLAFIASNPQYQLSLMGAAAGGFGIEIRRLIVTLGIANRVYFPDKFVSEEELCAEARKCFVALALYDVSPNNLTHYADPGKVKNSIEMGLPVVMTKISDIVPYVERYGAGEVIDSVKDLSAALLRIKSSPESYFAGCRGFAEHFDFEKYYGRLIGLAINGLRDLEI